ncbi:MAG TPA: HprK-related kinase B [Sedimenticola thiotaurini]|uniref:HprK-related kinase B n=1 Tax=Sedimenticola thiotaurini TaxID=1543721 RepID=A0A831W8I5_9GAMM|nr:HprK-related kinase B [Sedimenticola thiotaurini]
MGMDLATAADLLRGDEPLQRQALHLHLEGAVVRVRSNSAPLLQRLEHYFGHVTGPPAETMIEVIAIDRDPPDPGVAFRDWAREPGKQGRKDAWYDLPGGRLIRKVRTGMLFLQSESVRIAAGPCLEYDNQVINFINAQYMNLLQQRGCIICHASGLVHDGRCLGIAGFSGGGKSTLMLHLLAHDGIAFLTNDRLFICDDHGSPRALGIPKLPRVNPGTIVHDPILQSMIPEPERQRLLRLPEQQLWELEQKYDVMIDELYGPGKIVPSAPLASFLVLNWQRGSAGPLRVERVELAQRRDLLRAIMKSPGPFYQYADGHFQRDDQGFDEAAYLAALEGVTVHEARGGVDFDALTRHCLERIL